MPEPKAHPHLPQIKRVGWKVLIAGIVIMAIKFVIFGLTDSVAVLSDAMESVINIVASAFILYTIWLSNQPADREHPYGHGKVEFMAVLLEGWLILIAGFVVAFKAIPRLIEPPDLSRLGVGTWCLVGTSILTGMLAFYVRWAGRKYNSLLLVSDGKHLMTDFLSTVGVMLGLLLVRWTDKFWLDPVVALIMASLILWTSWKLLWQSISGLTDRIDEADDVAIRAILDEEVGNKTIRAYHKVRYRHSGAFHWVDMHLQVDPQLSVLESHKLASRIEHRVEQALDQANATAHIEPYEGDRVQDDARADVVQSNSVS